MDLFDFGLIETTPVPRYPQVAGYKDRDTSKQAAESIDASRLRNSCLRALKVMGAATSDAVADYLD